MLQSHISVEKQTECQLSKLIQQLKEEIHKAYDEPYIDYNRLGILKTELQFQYRLEEEYWRNKSRVLWLQEVIEIPNIFMWKKKKIRGFNKIIKIQNDQGQILAKAKDIQSHIISYFQSLYISDGANISQKLLDGIPRTVPEEINGDLTRPVTEEEIIKAIFAMNPDKSLGPDGMTAGFYQQH